MSEHPDTAFERWLREKVPAQVQERVRLGMPMEEMVITMMELAWNAAAAKTDRAWQEHCLRGLHDDYHETVVHMLQRWE